jgi:putative phosphoesterase
VIAVIADTHMPKGGRKLPPACLEVIAEAGALVHAGDFVGASTLAELEALCPRLYAVHGNVDEPELMERLPATTEVRVGGATIAVLHDAGPASGRLARMRARFPAADAVVFGHSHLPLHEEEDGFQIFNPGSPTERRRAPRRSMGTIIWNGSRLLFDHVWL